MRLNIWEEDEGDVMSMARAGAEIQRLASAVGFEARNTRSFDRSSRQLEGATYTNASGPSLQLCTSDLGSNAVF